ncbi:MAG: hypothetical protein WA919_09295 [Coleofasciculaceae cyanobacterium]
MSLLALVLSPSAGAENLLVSEPCSEKLPKELLEPDTLPPTESNIITDKSISQTSLTTPSFWWAVEQFNDLEGKLINDWIAYRDQKKLNLVVNRQLWSILDYLGRYSFVNRFGTVARGYQYNVRVFNQQGVLLASYDCNYSQTKPDCAIRGCQAFGQDSLEIPSR